MAKPTVVSTSVKAPAVPSDPDQSDDDGDGGSKDASIGVDRQLPATTAGHPANPGTSGVTTSADCGRDQLQRRADAYLLAMSTGVTQGLDLDPQLRYTENGEVVTLGAGLWLSAPRSDYARHFLDETQCSSLTVAVVTDIASQLVIGTRLRYLAGKLLEVESVFVRPNASWFSPEGIIPMGDDPWLQPIELSMRMSRDELISLAQHYFGSTVEPSLLPPHTPDCTVRQNGAPAGVSCGDVPGNEPYKQLRYLVVDESVGIVTTVAWRDSFLSIYVFKAHSNTTQAIEAIGGMRTANSGW